MKKIFLALSCIAIAGLFAFRAVDGPLPIGASIPKADLKMKDISGKGIALQNVQTKKGLLVMFSCNTCPYVIKNEERIREICTYAQSEGLGVVVINSNEAQRTSDDSYESMISYAKSQQFKWYYVVDENSQLADAFGANRTPETFLFDGRGKLLYHGAIDDSPADASKVTRNHLKEAINQSLSGQDVSVTESRSVGCTIKRKG
jgi:peroxiredoxin